MKFTIAGLVLAFSLAFVPTVHAQSTANDQLLSGNTLVKKCGDTDVSLGYCIGLIEGVGDMLEANDNITFPEGYTLNQGVLVVQKYLRDHPEELADRNTLLIVKALMKAFPKHK